MSNENKLEASEYILISIPYKDIMNLHNPFPEEWVKTIFTGLAMMAMNKPENRHQKIALEVVGGPNDNG